MPDPNIQPAKKKSHGCLIAVLVVVVLLVVAFAALTASCSAKDEVSEFTWPDGELASQIPVPSWAEVDEDGTATVTGALIDDSSDEFWCYVSVESVSDFNEYVSACEDAGFTVDYSKGSASFDALNEAGYALSLYFYDEDDSSYKTAVMAIVLYLPEEEDASDASSDAEEETEEADESASESDADESASDDDSDGVDPDFKQWCDDYEAFMNEYVDFMIEYQDADGSDLAALAVDYASYVASYTEWAEECEEYQDDEDLSDADLMYLAEVTLRVEERLLELNELYE